MIKNKIKKIILLTALISISIAVIHPNKIYLRPTGKIILYSNFTDDLYPFLYSNEKYLIDENTTIELLDEIDYYNGFFGDVIKVKITSGTYKDKIGYILEENALLSPMVLNNEVKVFFKNDIYYNNIEIKKDTVCRIEEIKQKMDKEVFVLKILTGNMAGKFLEYDNINDLHYIINKKTEVFYHIRKGARIIRILNPENLLPVKDTVYKNYKSDENGFIYLYENPKIIKLKKDGYNDCIVVTDNDNNIILAFMQKMDQVRYYDDRTSIYENNFYKFEIKNSNKSVNEKLGVKTLSFYDYSIFCYPQFKLNNKKIIGGFILTNAPVFSTVNCRIFKHEKNIFLYKFNEDSLNWEAYNLIYDGEYYSANGLFDGYYFLTINDDANTDSVSIKTNINYISNIFLKNYKGDFYKNINADDSTALIKGEYEAIYYNPENPLKINQQIIIIDEYTDTIKIIDKDYDYLSKFEPKKNQDNNIYEPKGLNSFFSGIWYKKAVKENNKFTGSKNLMEFLGDMELEGINDVYFYNDYFRMAGYIEVLDETRLNIIIMNVNNLIDIPDEDDDILVSPPLFYSQLIIPAYYSFHIGVLQLSFDGIYFLRKKRFNHKGNQNIKTYISTYSFLPPQFPQSEDKAKYKIFYSK